MLKEFNRDLPPSSSQVLEFLSNVYSKAGDIRLSYLTKENLKTYKTIMLFPSKKKPKKVSVFYEQIMAEALWNPQSSLDG